MKESTQKNIIGSFWGGMIYLFIFFQFNLQGIHNLFLAIALTMLGSRIFGGYDD